MAVTKIADVVVPEIYTPYKQLVTEQKSALIQSGVVARDESIDALLISLLACTMLSEAPRT